MDETKDRPKMTVGEVVDLASRGTVEISRLSGLQPIVLVTMLMTPTDTSVGVVVVPEVRKFVNIESLTDNLTKVLFEYTRDLFSKTSDGGKPS